MLSKLLTKLAWLQVKRPLLVILLSILVSMFMVVGVTNMSVETDMNKEMPQQLEVYQLSNMVSNELGGQDTMFVVVTLEKDSKKQNQINDIRDPRVVEYLIELENYLAEESIVDGVSSAGSIFQMFDYSSQQKIEEIIEMIPDLNSYYSNDLKTTLVFVNTDLGGGEEKVKEFEDTLNQALQNTNPPTGVVAKLTGNPSIRIVIFNLLIQDAIFTLSLSTVIIFILLIIMQRSFTRSLTVLAPLMLGLLWTDGTLGWIDMPLSIATVAIGAMILGLGVEYGIFMLSRYKEERDQGATQEHSIMEAVPNVGSALIGSGTTTMVGFLALLLSIMPMLQHLGLSLALGIFYTLISTIIVMPAIIVLGERIKHKYELYFVRHIVKRKTHKRMREKQWQKKTK